MAIKLKLRPVHLAVALYGFLLFWFIPHREVANLLFDAYEAGMRIGDVDAAISALALSLRFSFFGGMNLSLLSQAYEKHLKHMVSTVRPFPRSVVPACSKC